MGKSRLWPFREGEQKRITLIWGAQKRVTIGGTQKGVTLILSAERVLTKEKANVYNTSCCDISSLKTLRGHCWCKDSKHYEIQSLQ